MSSAIPFRLAPEEIRDALAQVPGVVAILAVDDAGKGRAVTLSSFVSISVEPPVVMVALSTKSRTAEMLAMNSKVGISILASSQQATAERFAGRMRPDIDFTQSPDFSEWDKVWVVRESNVQFSAQVWCTFTVGDHRIYLLSLTKTKANGGDALIYFNRQYRHVKAATERLSMSPAFGSELH